MKDFLYIYIRKFQSQNKLQLFDFHFKLANNKKKVYQKIKKMNYIEFL